MPRLVCEEFDDFVEALSGLQGEYVLRARPARDWRLRSVDLNGVTLMTGREGAATIYNGIGQEGYYHIYLLLSGHQAVAVDGRPFDHNDIAWIAPGNPFHTATSQPIAWLNVAVTTQLVSGWVQSHTDGFDVVLLGRNHIGPAPPSNVPLIRLARRLFQVDAQSPGALHTPAAEHAARKEVLDAVFGTMLPVWSHAAHRRHSERQSRMLHRALEVLEKMDDTVIHTADLCAAIGASERTVQNIFNDYLGMSPHQYLMTRRLHAIRTAIHHASPEDTITSICARFGVWDFGRLAKLYLEHFGTYPSQDLSARARSRLNCLAATPVHGRDERPRARVRPSIAR